MKKIIPLLLVMFLIVSTIVELSQMPTIKAVTPTIFYLPSSGTATVSPSYSANWEKNSQAARYNCYNYKIVSAAASRTFTETSAVSGYDVLGNQWVSAPIAAQTISGTVYGQILCSEANAAAEANPAIIIKVVSNDGSTVRGTLLSYFPDANGTLELAVTTLTNRMFPASTALNSVTAQDNDRIVIEMGARFFNTITTSYNTIIRMGDASATNLAVDNATTTANNPFIQFSQQIYFHSDDYDYGYATGNSTGYIQGNLTGYTDGWNSGNATGYSNGYSVGWNEGNATGWNAGWAVGNGTGYNSGWNAGNLTGYTNGYSNGYSVGYNDGWTVGNASGYNQGWAVGNNTGYLAGYNDGFVVGWATGNNTGYGLGWTNGNFTGYISGWNDGNFTGYMLGNSTGYTQGWNDGLNLGSIVYISPSTVLYNQATTFTFDNSFLGLSSPVNYTWSFGDNSTDEITSTPEITHTYIVNGTFALSVNVTALPFTDSSWNVSNDWQQPLGVYSTNILVLSGSLPTVDDGVLGVAIVFLLLAVTLPVAFFIIVKQKKESQ